MNTINWCQGQWVNNRVVGLREIALAQCRIATQSSVSDICYSLQLNIL